MCLIISTLLLLLALKVEGSASSFNTKQSSLLAVFSPMQMELENRFAVDLGSSPYGQNTITMSQYIPNHQSEIITVNEASFYWKRLWSKTLHTNRIQTNDCETDQDSGIFFFFPFIMYQLFSTKMKWTSQFKS